MQNGTIEHGLTTDYRYAYAFGMLRGEVRLLELELNYGSNAQIAKKARMLVELVNKIEKQLDDEYAKRMPPSQP